jgi:WD40 repeat protein
MADNQVQGKNGSVFISYSRKDKEFVGRLYAGLVTNDVKAWVDWEGIPLSADWMEEITRAVNGADAFLVVLSPDWLASKVCAAELELGLKSTKKLIPILYRDPLEGTTMPEKLAATNWVYMREQDDFDGTLPKLIDAITTDLDWVSQHTRLLGRAAEWDRKNRNPSFLLLGADLEDGEKWMSEAAQNTKRAVLPLQAEYIAASRKEAIRRQRMLLVGVSLALVVSVALAILAGFQWSVANDKEHARATQQFIAEANATLAYDNAATAVANGNARATQQAIAQKNEKLAKENETLARAQRNASEAKLYQDKAGKLNLSTLLAINSWQLSPSFQAEEILRQNITLLPSPVAQMSQAGRIYDINFSPDGNWFVSPGDDGTACVWNVKNGQKRYCVQHENTIYQAVFSADGKWLATASTDGSARLWNASDGSLSKRYDFGVDVWDVAFSPNSEWLIIAHDKGMRAVNLVNRLQKDRDVVTPSPAYLLAYSPDGDWAGIGTASGKILIWWTGSLYTSLGPTHLGEVLSMTFSSDGKYILSSGTDSTARIAMTVSGKELRSFRSGDWIEDIDFSPDDNWIVGASDDNQVWVWDRKTGESKLRLLHAGFVQKAKVSPNGLWIASTGFDHTLRIWDAHSGSQMLQASLAGIGSGLAFSPDGKNVIVGDRDGNINIWDISALSAKIGFIEFAEYVHEVKLSPDGKRLFANSDDQKVWSFDLNKILSIHTVESARNLFSTEGLTYAMEISPDSNWLVVAESQIKRAVLYDLKQGKTTFLNHGEEVNGIAFAPDSRQVATSDKDGKVILWDVQTGEKKAELVNASAVLGIAISPDGSKLVAGLDGPASTTVWDLTTKTKIAELGQVGNVNAVQFSQDGAWVAAGDNLGVIKIWNAQDFSIKEPVRTLQLNSKVLNLLFSPDRRWLVVGSSDGYAQIFDMVSGNEISRLPHIDEVTGLAFSADGKQLFTVSRKVVQIWDISKLILTPTDQLIDTACSRLVANFSSTEWQTLFSTETYRPICPNLPQGKD